MSNGVHHNSGDSPALNRSPYPRSWRRDASARNSAASTASSRLSLSRRRFLTHKVC